MRLPAEKHFRCEILSWHVWEDMVSLVKKIKATGAYSEEDICGELKKRYSIDVKIDTERAHGYDKF